MCDRLRYIVKNIPQGKNMSPRDKNDKFPLMTYICARHTRSPTRVEYWQTWRKAEELVSKRGSSSIIWNWFGFKKSEAEQHFTMCKACKLVPTKDSNTTNLFHHLKHKHKPEYEDSQKMCEDAEAASTSTKASGKKPTTQTKLADAFTHYTPYDHQSKPWKELTEAVAFCLPKDMLPL